MKIRGFGVFSMAVVLIVPCLFAKPVHAMRKVCNPVPTWVTYPDGTTGPSAGDGNVCVEVPDDQASAEGINNWMRTIAISDRTNPPAPRDLPQGNGGGPIKGSEPIEYHGEFTFHDEDVSFPGLGTDFHFSRSYSNFSVYFGALGHGWSHKYERALVTIVDGSRAGTLEYVDGEGAIRFHTTKDSTTSFEPDANGIGYQLTTDGKSYILKDGSGLSYIFKDDFKLPWKPLVAIRDALGHQQTINWTKYDERTWPDARIASVQDTTGRKVYFNYKDGTYCEIKGESRNGSYCDAKNPPQKKTFLQCLSLTQDDCSKPLVSFEYNDVGELKSVKDAVGHGNTYVYDDGYSPQTGLPTASTEQLCSTMCGSSADDFHNVDICHSTRCLSRVNSESACQRSCIDLYPSRVDLCGKVCVQNKCASDTSYLGDQDIKVLQDMSKTKIFDACMADFFKDYSFCKGSVRQGSDCYPVSLSSPQECLTQCRNNYSTKAVDGNPIQSYGLSQDLNHNLIAVYDGEGRLIIKNQYGTDAQQISFDRVTDQWLGAETEENHIRLSYFDLKGAGVVSWNETERPSFVWSDYLIGMAHAAARLPDWVKPGLKSSPVMQTRDMAVPNTPMEVNAGPKIASLDFSQFVVSSTDFKSVTICPQLGDSRDYPPDTNFIGPSRNPPVPGACDPGPCAPDSLLFDLVMGSAWAGSTGRVLERPGQAAPQSAQSQGMMGTRAPVFHTAAQVPVLATVAQDLYGGIRTYYLDKNNRLLREVLYSNGGQGYLPYETTDLNYILKPGRIDRAVAYPSGERVCMASTVFDLPQTVTDFPAIGYGGEQAPRISSIEYDTEGNPTKLMREDGWSVEYDRDPQQRIRQIKAIVDAARNQTVTATYAYANNTDVMPAQITAPDGSVTEQGSFDPAGTGPQTITLDKNSGAASVGRYASYYPSGRIKERGITGQSGSYLEYLDNHLPRSMKVRKDPGSPWYETSYTYNAANQLKTVETPDIIRRLQFDSLGNLNFTSEQPKDNISEGKKTCYNYSPDGRLLAAMLPKGNVEEYAYDPAGRISGVRVGYPVGDTPWAKNCLQNNFAAALPQVGENLDAPPPNARKGMEEGVSFTYKPGGFLEKVRQNGIEHNIVTDGYGRIIDRIDPNGNHHRAGYSLYNDDILWTADYDSKAPAYGRPDFPNASLLRAAEYEHDGLGRPRTVSEWHFAGGKPVGAELRLTTQFSYDDANHVTVATANGASITTKFDGLGRLLYQTLPNDSRVTAQWDTKQNQVTWTRPGPQGNSIKTIQVFDGFGGVSRVIDDQGRVVLQNTSDLLGRVVESRPDSSGVRRIAHDSFGRVYQTRQEVQPNVEMVLTNTWGKNDEPLAFKDGNGNLTRSRYDGQGRLAARLDAAGRSTLYDYVPGTSRMQRVLLPDGKNPVPDNSSTQVINEYDAAGLLMRQSIKHGANVVNHGNKTTVREFWYTPLGQMATARLTDANNGALTDGMVDWFAYDSLGNAVFERSSLLPFEIRHLTDPRNRKSYTTIGKAVIERGFDVLGRLQTLALDGQPLGAFKYTGPDTLTGIAYGNGAAGSLAYDRRGFVSDVQVKDRNQGSLLSLHMAYGFDGSPRWKKYSIGKSGPARHDFFEVDGAGRLIAEGSGLKGETVGGNLPVNPVNADVAALLEGSPKTRKYALDMASNWTKVEKRIDRNISVLRFTPNANNAYTVAEGQAPRHDPAGNLVAFPAKNPTEKFTYNGLGQILGATSGEKTSAFYYDALGRRVAEMNGHGDMTYYAWDGNTLVASGDSRSDENSFKLNVMLGANAPFARVEQLGKGNRVFFHSGPDGSVMAVSDSQSGLVEGSFYDAYGKPTFLGADGRSEIPSSKIGNYFLFQGMIRDQDSGLYLTPARAFKSNWGRFITRDPIGLAGGQNPYAYVNSSPQDWTDPSGLDPKSQRGNEGNSRKSYAQQGLSTFSAPRRSQWAVLEEQARKDVIHSPAVALADAIFTFGKALVGWPETSEEEGAQAAMEVAGTIAVLGPTKVVTEVAGAGLARLQSNLAARAAAGTPAAVRVANVGASSEISGYEATLPGKPVAIRQVAAAKAPAAARASAVPNHNISEASTGVRPSRISEAAAMKDSEIQNIIERLVGPEARGSNWEEPFWEWMETSAKNLPR
ncbi:MAG: RHS repeat-associated core domain-containing protein [Pseudomonadota bacterium]